MDASNWDNHFAGEEYVFGVDPDAFLVAQTNRLQPGMRALSVGDGEGRNGVWMASKGLDVLSVDISSVALKKASNLAWQRGVPLGVICADLATWPWPKNRFDVVTQMVARRSF